ncbi:MAG: outer membrane assembly lipoprotein YfiO [Geobacter sp.]|nr:outer membrane assembly lipoprotein YfiO [Geobacter sp.]
MAATSQAKRATVCPWPHLREVPMISHHQLFAALCITLVLSAGVAGASSDYFCNPRWTLVQSEYASCSNVPFLSPGNDRRVNLKLLLVDAGLAKLQTQPIAQEDSEQGYGNVPFSVKNFESNVFLANDAVSSIKKEDMQEGTNEVSRCVSNEIGKNGFVEALGNTGELPDAERQLLADARLELKPRCVEVFSNTSSNSASPAIKALKITSASGNEFRQYLLAITSFYEGRYDEALDGFGNLADSSQAWLRETSRYMLGRTRLNHSQKDAFDEYGFPDLKKVDQQRLAAAEDEFNKYLQEYPNGVYAPSARGLLRRVYWMGNRPRKLAEEYAWQLKHPESPQHNLSLDAMVLEADNKLFDIAQPEQMDNPIFLATLDLSLMRTPERIDASGLEKQLPVFAGHKPLYDYLLAAHSFYVQKDPAGALKTLPADIPPEMTYLDFSRLILRGLALEETKDHRGARQLWLSLLPVCKQPLQAETVQLALALNYEQANEIELAFEEKSPITESAIRNILIRNDASPDLLRRIIQLKDNAVQERHLALYTLLYKDLLKGHYQRYIEDYALLPQDAAKYTAPQYGNYGEPQLALFTWSGVKNKDNYGCPSTLEIAKILAKDPQDPAGLICLGDFVKSNNLGSLPGYRDFPDEPRADAVGAVLGSAPSRFTGETFSRGEAYKRVMADTHAPHDLKAYALFRAIKCYAPSGYNDCGGNEVAISVRRSWFKTLKNDYPDTTWAKSLKYYW